MLVQHSATRFLSVLLISIFCVQENNKTVEMGKVYSTICEKCGKQFQYKQGLSHHRQQCQNLKLQPLSLSESIHHKKRFFTAHRKVCKVFLITYVFSSIIGNVTFSSFSYSCQFLQFYDNVFGMHINQCTSLISSISFNFDLRTRYVLGNPGKSNYCW